VSHLVTSDEGTLQFLREKAVDGWNAATKDAYPMEKNP
jgi:hypothetical protein